MFLPILLQIEEGDGIPKADKRILRNDGDVVGPEVEVPESVQRPESVAGDFVQVVVAQTQILQVLCAKTNQKIFNLLVSRRKGGEWHSCGRAIDPNRPSALALPCECKLRGCTKGGVSGVLCVPLFAFA